MFFNRFDDPLCFQLSQSLPGKTSIDLQPFHKNTHTHKSIRADFFEEFVVGGFIEEDGIVGFVLDFAFGPFLLLGWERSVWSGDWMEPVLPWVEGPAAFAMVGDGLSVRADSWWRKEQSQSGGKKIG